MKGKNYDYKEAYNKNLTAKARLHYLENARNDQDNSPAKQIGIVDPLTGQPVQQMTNVPPQQANTLGNAQPVFNQSVQQAAQGIYGGVDQRQNSVGATPLFQEKQFWKPQEHVEPPRVKMHKHRPKQKEINHTIKDTNLFQEEKTIPNPAPIVEPPRVKMYEPIPKIKMTPRT